MPFPLAHPAAALPLLRFCPGYLSFSALIIGSIVPDVAYSIDDLNKFSRTLQYLLGPVAGNLEYVRDSWDWDDFSHTFVGSICFCLPVGLFLIAGFFAFRSALVATLPNPHREVLLPLCRIARNSVLVEVSSLLIGIWLHIGWDCFTNGDRWTGQHWGFLHFRVIELGSVEIQLYRALWWISSLWGAAVLLTAYVQFLKCRKRPLWESNQGEVRYYFLWAAALLISAAIATSITLHFNYPGPSAAQLFSFCHRFAGYFLACLCGCIALVAIVIRLVQLRPAAK